MSRTALLRFAPGFTPLLVDDPKLVREYMVERGAIQPPSLSKPIPVLVNHDESRQIGTVRTLAIYDEVLSGSRVAPYYVAHVNITGPTAMQRGDGVSWGFRILREMELAGTKLIRSALIEEVSVLTPPMKPAEVFARVAWVGELEKPKPKLAPATSSDRAAGGEVVYGDGRTITRHGVRSGARCRRQATSADELGASNPPRGSRLHHRPARRVAGDLPRV